MSNDGNRHEVTHYKYNLGCSSSWVFAEERNLAGFSAMVSSFWNTMSHYQDADRIEEECEDFLEDNQIVNVVPMETCSMCNRSIPLQSILLHTKDCKQRLLSGSVQLEEELNTSYCGSSMLTENKVYDTYGHVKIEVESKKYKHNDCGQTFRNDSHLKSHMDMHSNCEGIVRTKYFNYDKILQRLNTRIQSHAGEKFYECKDCNKKFKRSSHLSSHMMVHSTEKNYQCNVCGRLFKQSFNLKTHMTLHTGDRQFECNICGRKFSQKGNLKAHLTVHSDIKAYECNTCGKRYKQKYQLKSHMKVHCKDFNYVCSICGAMFKQKFQLRSHMKLHNKEKVDQCNVSGKKGIQVVNVVPMETCLLCNKSIPLQSILLHTMVCKQKLLPRSVEIEEVSISNGDSHTVTDDQQFTEEPQSPSVAINEEVAISNADGYIAVEENGCKQIPLSRSVEIEEKVNIPSSGSYRFTDELAYDHVIIKSGSKEYECNDCGKTFKRSSHLKSHINTHSCECKVCGMYFSCRSRLKTHILSHAGKKVYECLVCSKQFKRSSHLSSHMMVHSNEKHYQCNVCGKNFKQNCNLKTHMTLHTGERKYECNVCGRKFSQNGNLKAHLTVHSDIKDFECTICGKTFKQRYHLKSHMNVHTKQKDYECNVCGKMSKQHGSISCSHIKIHTGYS